LRSTLPQGLTQANPCGTFGLGGSVGVSLFCHLKFSLGRVVSSRLERGGPPAGKKAVRRNCIGLFVRS
jgi:hypothetical protein